MIINFDKRGGGSGDAYTKAQTDALVSSAYTSGVTYTDNAISDLADNDRVNDFEETTSRAINDLFVKSSNALESISMDISDLSDNVDAVSGSVVSLSGEVETFSGSVISEIDDLYARIPDVTELEDEISGLGTRVETLEGDISDKVSSSDIEEIVRISQTDYDAMSAHSSTVLYVIG